MPDIAQVLIGFLFGTGTTGAIAIWVFRHRSALIAVAAWFYRTFSWLTTRFEYGNVAYNIEATVNRAADTIDRDAPEVLPYPIKISWAKTAQELETSLQKGQIVVTMQYSENRDRNLVVATLAYLYKGLLTRARPYVDRALMKATDFTVAKDIFQRSSLELAIPYFFENYLEPAAKEEPSLRERLTHLERIHTGGFFTRVFLREIKYLGDRVFPATPDERMWQETTDFAEFLADIAEKERGIDVPGGLLFPGSRIRTSIMLVARSGMRLRGTKPYMRRIQMDLDRGVDRMYVFARGENNIKLARDVVDEARQANLLSIAGSTTFTQSVEARDQEAICIATTLNLLTRPAEQTAASQGLLELLREIIPELQNGTVEVVAASRQPGVKSKIAVRSLAYGQSPIASCTEEGRKEAVETILGETVEFIEWSNDPAQLIVSALAPLDPADIATIETDLQNKRAEISVTGWKPKRTALGKGDVNVRLAAQLTSWHITVTDLEEISQG